MAINQTVLAKLTSMYAAAKGPGAKARITGDMRSMGYPEDVIASVKGVKANEAAVRKATLAELFKELNLPVPANKRN
jgi:hypothetical protein